MSLTQILLCLFGISVTLYIDTAEARSARRLKAEGIVGGDDANEGQFPYQVSLYFYGLRLCGGSILSERFVITAAHCVVDEDGEFFVDSVYVVAGTSDLTSTSKDEVTADIAEVFVPKEYNRTDKNRFMIGDIAVLKLKKDLGIAGNSKLGKVELPSKDKNYDGVNATASGFGYNSIDIVTNPLTGKKEEDNGRSTDKLRYATAKVIISDDCQKSYPEIATEKQICAALVQRNENKPEGLCSGDSGGPLVYDGALIGVISHTPFGCHEDSAPALYTRVSKYIDFINNVVDGKVDDSIRSIAL